MAFATELAVAMYGERSPCDFAEQKYITLRDGAANFRFSSSFFFCTVRHQLVTTRGMRFAYTRKEASVYPETKSSWNGAIGNSI